MRFLLGAIGLTAIVGMFADRLSREPRPNNPVVATIAQPRIDAETATGVAGEIKRAADAHFYVDAQVNGARIRMMVDTGASSVVLTRADALAAGIPAGAGEFSATGVTAGGAVALKPARIARIAVGTLAVNDVPAMVAESALPVSLLGQSYLARVRSVEIRGDRMILR